MNNLAEEGVRALFFCFCFHQVDELSTPDIAIVPPETGLFYIQKANQLIEIFGCGFFLKFLATCLESWACLLGEIL